jgi:hypothetical protein
MLWCCCHRVRCVSGASIRQQRLTAVECDALPHGTAAEQRRRARVWRDVVFGTGVSVLLLLRAALVLRAHVRVLVCALW